MNFFELYDYMICCLLQVNLCNDVQVIEEVEGLFSNIVEVWKQILLKVFFQEFC